MQPRVSRVSSAELPTRYGRFRIAAYCIQGEAEHPIVLTMGNLRTAESPLVRIHSSCFTGDLLSSLRCDCGDQLQLCLKMIANEGVGAVIYLHQEGRGIGLVEKIKAYSLQDQGMDTVEANLALGHKADERDYRVAVRILHDLGASRVRLMTNNPQKTAAVVNAGGRLRVVGQIPVTPPANEYNVSYLATKRERMGHAFPEPIVTNCCDED